MKAIKDSDRMWHLVCVCSMRSLCWMLLVGCGSDIAAPVTQSSPSSADAEVEPCDIAVGPNTFSFLLDTPQASNRLCLLDETLVLIQFTDDLTCEKCIERAKLFQGKPNLILSLNPKSAAPLVNSEFRSFLQEHGSLEDLVLALDSKQRMAKLFSLQNHSIEDLLKKIFGDEPKVDPESAEDIRKRALSLLDAEVMKKELSFFSSDAMNGRLSATPENESAAEYIVQNLKELNIQPGQSDGYLQKFRVSKGPTRGQTTANIIGLIEGRDPVLKSEYIVVGAHMDHAGTLSKGYTCSRGASSNNICNGADDNGSGSIALLNIAKALVASRDLLERSVVLMWFSGEELGLEGSRYYVNSKPTFPLDKTVYMINLDMVGYIHTNQNRMGALGAGTSGHASSFLKSISGMDGKHSLVLTDRAGGGSDHVPFMAKGIPGVFFNTGVNNNPNYHRTSDTADKISYDGMVYATQIAFELVHAISSYRGFMMVHSLMRQPLVTEEEMEQGCHELIINPFVQELDFTHSN